MRKFLVSFLLCMGSASLMAQYEEHKTPEQIEQELQSAEAQFQRAKKMFNPWYTGPLQTPSASNMPPGWGNIQPYLYVTDNYARFNSERHSKSLSSNLVTVNPTTTLQFGVTSSMDITLGLQAFANWQYDHHGAGFGDTSVSLGFVVCAQTKNVPGIRFVVKQYFPTGQYQHLNSNGLGLSATGAGAYQTQFSLNLSKVVFWSYLHPMNIRFSFNYVLPTCISVRDFNTYGGGFGTHATVHPGNNFSADMGLEFSLTQRWVLATDLCYSATNSTSYSGYAGLNADGSPASIGGGFNDNLSLAPAIEYNWNENLGVLGGVWFSVYGRNSLNFVSGVISVCWTFPVK